MKHLAILTKQKTALIIIDMQEKFAPAIPSFAAITANITKLILGFQLFKIPCIVTEQYPQGLGPTVEPIKQMFPILEIIEKNEFACTDNTDFWKAVNPLHIETFVVCGVESHVCINQTVLGLIAKKHTVHVVADAIGSRKNLDHDLALKKMERAGALLTTTEMCLFELIEKAGTESFKTIQKALKINGPIVLQNNSKGAAKSALKITTIAPAAAPGAATSIETKPAPAPQAVIQEPSNSPEPSTPPNNAESMAEFEINTDIALQPAPTTDIVAESTLNNAAKALNESNQTLENIDNDLAAFDLSALTKTENDLPSGDQTLQPSIPEEFNLEDLDTATGNDASPSTNT